jgi:hypothetical protein
MLLRLLVGTLAMASYSSNGVYGHANYELTPLNLRKAGNGIETLPGECTGPLIFTGMFRKLSIDVARRFSKNSRVC